MHSLASFGVDNHTVHFKILAAGQQLRRHALPIFQHTQRLFRLCAAMKICHIQRLVDMQFPLFTVFTDAVIIVQAVGQVGIFLNFCHQRPCPDGMDSAGLDKEQVILMDGYLL